ncbi:hypothetical protein KUCAC02_010109 [Chaenocephalus aceratus]|uniref:Uncharacterized protein n=1 Tax=Chaenocephalus aceratus TaxID=36190 RepID=A0ACB9VYD4_CHAAC|nr:hypothetical protein KUCAC02_010109 [Chaenocephalus aceratus]
MESALCRMESTDGLSRPPREADGREEGGPTAASSKKMLGKNSKSLVERRQKELELYLQQFPEATPSPLACFLHFHVSTLEAPPTYAQ